jgi:hypothetical protein
MIDFSEAYLRPVERGDQSWPRHARRRTHSSIIRTSTMQVWKKKTTLCVIGATVLSAGLQSGVVAEGPTAAMRASGAERHRAAAGWLRLESDQRQSRELAAPLTPLDSQRLQIIEQQERARYREQLQTQERELGSLNRQERQSRDRAAQGPSPQARLRARLLEQQRAQSGLELRRQMDRRSQGSPPGRILPR